MLALIRRQGESIIIGDNIRVKVIEVMPGRVRLGIDAPRDIRVDREEVRESINRDGPRPTVR